MSREKKCIVFDKEVDLNTIEVNDVDLREYPEFESATISLGFFKDGAEMQGLDKSTFIEDYNTEFYLIIINNYL